MQICFDDYDQEDERSDIVDADDNCEIREENKECPDDEEVDRLFVDTDEKLNTTAAEEYFRGDFQLSRNKPELSSQTFDSQTQATISLGPTLHM